VHGIWDCTYPPRFPGGSPYVPTDVHTSNEFFKGTVHDKPVPQASPVAQVMVRAIIGYYTLGKSFLSTKSATPYMDRYVGTQRHRDQG